MWIFGGYFGAARRIQSTVASARLAFIGIVKRKIT